MLDEDTSATNFMIRDKVMARLVSDEKEPITTLLRHIRGIYRTLGISFVIVVGSSEIIYLWQISFYRWIIIK